MRPPTETASDPAAGSPQPLDSGPAPAPVAGPVVGPVVEPASTPAAPAPAPTPTPSPPTHQPTLAAALVQLRGRPDGVSELTVQLHPAELGAVQIRARLSGGTLDVTVACADETARHAVTAALPALHSELGTLGSVDVTLGSPQPTPQTTPQAAPQPGRDRPADAGNAPFQQQPQSRERRPDDERPHRRRPAAEERFEQWM